jgi:predicted dehydrogenase
MKRARAERVIRSQPRRGETIPVETATHVAAILEFRDGLTATLVVTWDVWDLYLPSVEVYGSRATLSLPDPNTFGGPVRVRRGQPDEWSEVALTHAHAANSRGIGVADLAASIRAGRPARAGGELAFHVLDVMHAVFESAETGRRIELESMCERPTPLQAGLAEFSLE